MSEPKRVLQILPGLNVCGGIESFVMNYYFNIDRTRVQFDFIAHSADSSNYISKIKELGARVEILPPIGAKSYYAVQESVKSFFERHRDEYRIVHCHMANAAFLYLRQAKNSGIPVRILHSHQTQSADILSHKIRNNFLLPIGRQYANVNCACSEAAGDFLFGKDNYKVIHNAISTERFSYNTACREEVRKELKVENRFVVGHAARLIEQKNQDFLIDIFCEIKKQNSDAILLLIGEGPLLAHLQKKVYRLGLENDVLFLGTRKDIDRLYQAMDVFVLPSLYEGLPVVGVEAQAAGLNCFFSDTITVETKVTELAQFIPLRQTAAFWARQILSTQRSVRKNMSDEIAKAGYDIATAAKDLENYYLSR